MQGNLMLTKEKREKIERLDVYIILRDAPFIYRGVALRVT